MSKSKPSINVFLQAQNITLVLFVYVLASLLFVTWYETSRLSAFDEAQQQFSQNALTSASYALESQLKEVQRSVDIITREKAKVISELSTVLDKDSEVYLQLNKLLHQYFPEMNSFSLASNDGELLLDDFDGLIGDGCINNIKLFAIDQEAELKHLHPNPAYYHFDFMSQWQQYPLSGIFFISFKPEFIANILKYHEPSGVNLLLINESKPDLIEFTSKGGRNDYIRNWTLTEIEKQDIAASAHIHKTQWTMIAINDAEKRDLLLASIAKDKQFLIIFLVTIALILFSALIFSRRIAIQNSLRIKKNSVQRIFWAQISAGITVIAVFLLDIYLPLGVAGGVPYVLFILLGWFCDQRSKIIVYALVASFLTLIGFSLSPVGGLEWVVYLNRFYALLAIWSTAVVLWVAKSHFQQIDYQSTHDRLTGLKNRSVIEERIYYLMKKAQQTGQVHALCLLDLDQFKTINDNYGHQAGDAMLKEIARCISDACKNQFILARISSDEFVILMENTSTEEAYLHCEDIRKSVDKNRFEWDGNVLSLSISVGIAAISKATEEKKGILDFLMYADMACDGAKADGGNRSAIYNPHEQRYIDQANALEWINKVKVALDKDQFVLYAQPIVPLSDKSLPSSYEILVRMLDEDGSIIAPGVFLPAVEKYGLAHKLDIWVLKHTFSWLEENMSKLDSETHFAINLSGQSLNSETLKHYLTHYLAQTKLPTQCLKFEITESAAIADFDVALKFIEAIEIFGCTFALDDFGSGLSSFAYLQKLPVSYLKIDGMFVKNIVNNRIDETMVNSINEIGHVMGLLTIAEFVENDQITDKLIELGIDYGQGYGLGRPMLLSDIVK